MVFNQCLCMPFQQITHYISLDTKKYVDLLIFSINFLTRWKQMNMGKYVSDRIALVPAVFDLGCTI